MNNRNDKKFTPRTNPLKQKKGQLSDAKHSKKRGRGMIAILIIIVILAVLVFGFAVRKISNKLENKQQLQSQSSNVLTSEQIQQIKQRRTFAKTIAEPAIKVYQNNFHVLPSIVIAQAILESDWGNSKLYQVAKNPFGIKGTYNGQSISYDTTEYVNGKKITVAAQFRKYPTLEAAIKDHDKSIKTHFIKEENVTSYVKAANLLQKNTYATDPQYAKKLISVIKQYDLSRYDLQALNNN